MMPVGVTWDADLSHQASTSARQKFILCFWQCIEALSFIFWSFIFDDETQSVQIYESSSSQNVLMFAFHSNTETFFMKPILFVVHFWKRIAEFFNQLSAKSSRQNGPFLATLYGHWTQKKIDFIFFNWRKWSPYSGLLLGLLMVHVKYIFDCSLWNERSIFLPLPSDIVMD